MAGISQRKTKRHDPDSRYGGSSPQVGKANPLDDAKHADLYRMLQEWWLEASERHAANRIERFTDHDYYDHEQISPDDRAVYEARRQAPVVFNLIHGAIDWLTGTERRTRIDWAILPRGPEDEPGAKAQTHLLKFVSDANRAGWERSRAFKDACISGVGFVEEYLRNDESMERCGYGYVDWRHLWWDPFSRDLDYADARYIHRVKLVDLDRAIAMCPERAADLRAASFNSVDDEFMLLDNPDNVPAMFVLGGNGFGAGSSHAGRQRVRMIETWFPRTLASKRIKAKIAECAPMHDCLYDAADPKQAEALEKGTISLTDTTTTRMWMALWVDGVGLCELRESPYQHNLPPFTPVWCFRHHRDGMPYGYVRGMRDAQDEYNKRRAKALYAASTNRVLYEGDAFDEDDERESLDQISMPNGEIRLAPGGMAKIKIETSLDVAQAHVAFQAEAKEHIYEGNGITRENLGQQTNAISGRAIVAKQQQGAVTTAEVYDLYRLAIEISGQKQLSNLRVGMSLPRQIRILGGNEGHEWLQINQPELDPITGEVLWNNDIQNTLSDFKVGEQDFRETLRMAMAESLLETIGKLPPEVSMQLIDLAIELTDLPNKQKFIERIQRLNGTTPAPIDEAQQMEADKQTAAMEREAQLAEAERAAAIEDKQAGAELKRAKAKEAVVKGQTDAMGLSQLVSSAIPNAVIADELYAGASASPATPVPPGVTQ